MRVRSEKREREREVIVSLSLPSVAALLGFPRLFLFLVGFEGKE